MSGRRRSRNQSLKAEKKSASRTELFEQAKEEALRRATQAVEDLNALGLKYRLVETGSAAGTKGAGAPGLILECAGSLFCLSF
jgi:hypothetical protein